MTTPLDDLVAHDPGAGCAAVKVRRMLLAARARDRRVPALA
jgi:hypothetical protein